MIYLAYKGWKVATAILAILFTLTVAPISHDPWEAYMYSWIFVVWRKYFSYEFENLCKMEKGKKYIFFEFPHGIFPMGQFLSSSLIPDTFPGEMVCGLAADIVFYIPVIRQLLAWAGARRASRKSIKELLGRGFHVAILTGGIAEMYLVNDDIEGVYLRKRQNAVRAAIEEGAQIVPTFFFGNSKILKAYGNDKANTWLASFSRKLRASVVFCYGRWWLPIPLRHPLKLVIGEPVAVTQNLKPTNEEVDQVLQRVIAATEKLYAEHKPAWETRPLVVY